MRNELYKSIKQRFDREGVEIPFPHRTVILKNNTPQFAKSSQSVYNGTAQPA